MPSIDPAQVKAESHSVVGNIIQRDIGEIIARWSRRALEEQPNASGLHRETLQDHLPLFLWEVGRSLIETDPEAERHQRPALEHGEQRWEIGWSLEEVALDYQILRLVLIDHLEKQVDRSLRSREIMAIGLLVDEAICASIRSYSRSTQQARPDPSGPLGRAEPQETGAAGRSTRELHDVLSVLAHEARNSLAPVKQAVQVLRLKAQEASTREWAADVIDRQTDHLVRLVDDLLDLSRISRGSLSLRRQRVDLANLLRSTAEDMRPIFQAKDIDFSIELPTKEVIADVDTVRIAQVLTNLLHNAAKFTPPKGRVAVTGAVDPDGKTCTVEVIDSGIGIAPEDLDSIFERYIRRDKDVEGYQAGLGLGLALIRGLVECHGGRVTVESQGEHKGSVFAFWLPLLQTLPEEEGQSPPKSKPSHDARVLVIEDNRDSAESLQLLLSASGYEVRLAHTGDVGLALALTWRPDFVICDIGLPGLRGDEIARGIEAEKPARRPTLIAMSGYSSPGHRESALAAGFDHYLIKPVDLSSLLACLQLPRS